MKEEKDVPKIVYGEVLDYLEKVESSPLLTITLAEATKLSQLYRFIGDFIPDAFIWFVKNFIFKKTLPVPEAPIASWESVPRERTSPVSGDYEVGWAYVSIRVLEKLDAPDPGALLENVKDIHLSARMHAEKKLKKKFQSLSCIVLKPDWEKTKEILKLDKTGRKSRIPTNKFIAQFRKRAKAEGIEVLTFKGFFSKYEKTITDSRFKESWSEYLWKLYLDFVKHFPMLAYSLCHDDYLSYRDNRSRAEVDVLDGKYPEAITMHCKALEAVLRIYYLMENMKEAPDKELGWLYNSLKKHIIAEMGEIYCQDLEFVLAHRPHAVHTKKKKIEITELEAREVSDRINIFCNTFFYKKWKIRI